MLDVAQTFGMQMMLQQQQFNQSHNQYHHQHQNFYSDSSSLFSSAHAPFDLPEVASTSSSFPVYHPKPWASQDVNAPSSAASTPDLSEWFNYGFSEETFIYFINQQVITIQHSIIVDRLRAALKRTLPSEVEQQPQLPLPQLTSPQQLLPTQHHPSPLPFYQHSGHPVESPTNYPVKLELGMLHQGSKLA